MVNFTLEWGIKDSLIAYVKGLSDGVISMNDVTNGEGKPFIFDGVAEPGFDAQKNEGTLAFSGSVNLSGHDGMMQISIVNPLVELSGSTGMLLLSSPSSRTRFALLSQTTSSENSLEFDVRLTNLGSVFLGGQYPAGTYLSPLRIERVPIR